MKKAISAATSAALLASLLATAVAPSAFASVAVTSVGSIPVGGTSSGTATFLFTERAANGSVIPSPNPLGCTADVGLNDAAGTMTVTIDGPTAGQVTFSGTAAVSAPASLGATASAAGNLLTISWTHSDCKNIETISITGLKIKAVAGATPGPVSATLSGNFSGWFVAPTTATATGTILSSNELTAGADTANVLLSSVCRFVPTGDSVNNSNATFSDTTDSRAVTSGATVVAGVQAVGFAAGAATHAAGTVVTQTVNYATACVGAILPSAVGVIGNAVKASTNSTATVYPGESNGVAGNLIATEPTAGFLPKDATLTWTIATAGVVFSKAPVVSVNDASTGTDTLAASAAALSGDRKTVVVTITAVSSGALSTITLGSVLYDVESTVAGGTYVDVNLTLSGGLLVTGNPVENAIVFRGITASAPTPTVYIGENNQATGLVTLTEAAAGFFNAGTGTNNVLTVCDTGVNYDFTTAPWAKVTAGDLRLREGNVSSPDNIVQATAATPDATSGTTAACFSWTVWTASTTASTIVIGNSDFTSGPLINVATSQAPGIVAMIVKSGNGANFDAQTIATVGFANAEYRNQVAVTALSQPFIAPGATNAPAGDLQIAETGLGQLKAGENICVEVLWRSGELQDQFLNGLSTADLPIATASGTGLVIGPVSGSADRCSGANNLLVPAGYMESFHFTVLQQSTAGNGKLVISNIRYTTLTDSAEGPVQLSVWGMGGSPTNVIFHSTVSNAKIGTAAALSKLNIGAYSALGLRPTTGYTTKTPKVTTHGKYITWKFTGGLTLKGQRVNVMVAKKINGVWGGPVYFKSIWADANGIATFAWHLGSAGAINVRVQWPGNGVTYGVSTSPARGAYWK